MATVVELTQSVRAPSSVVWPAISTRSGLAGWQADRVQPVTDVSLRDTGQEQLSDDDALRVGDKIALQWSLPGATAVLEVVALEANHSIALAGEMGTTELSLRDGAVRVRSKSSLADAAELRASWQLALCQLAHYAERHPGRKRQVYWTSAKLSGSPELFHAYFTEETLLKQWFTSFGHIPSDGRFELMLSKNQQRLTGQVLHNPGSHDVLLTLENHADATLIFRTLGAVSGTDLHLCAICLSTWGVIGDSVELLEEHIRGSLQVLRRALASRGAC